VEKQGSQAIRSVCFKTLGCKLNQSETDAIQHKFTEKGYQIKSYGEPADLTIINTCTVTNSADSGSRAAIRQAIRNSPKGRIAVTGCYAQVSPDEIKSIQGVDMILGNDEKYKIFNYLDEIREGKIEEPLVYVNDEGGFAQVSEDGFVSATSRARAFLKVQEGCNYYCSYCIIPFSRGRARSRSLADSVQEASRLADEGYQEIVLTGINIGTYDFENGKQYTLVDLLDALQNVNGIERIRLSSIEPNTVSDDLLHLARESKVICPHLHIPLQSGNDDQLQAMNRKYCIEEYQGLMDRFSKTLPHAALGSDVIVGFPGETEEHFENTLNFIQSNPFTYLHIFRYSDRKGTAASKMPNKVDPQTIKKRSQVLHQLSKKLKTAYYQKYLGQKLTVLFDQTKNGKQVGYTENYLQVSVESPQDIRKQILDVELIDINERGLCTGKLL
jgi:threonylcarbamoyladenosine tRNA methylthiotransferase MtaB